MNPPEELEFTNPDYEVSRRPPLLSLLSGSNDYVILGIIVHNEFNKKDYKYCGNHPTIETRDSSAHHYHNDPDISCTLYSKKDIQG